MYILLDTHILLWAIDEPWRLTEQSRAAIQDGRNVILFSAITILEIAIKSALRRRDFPSRPEHILKIALATGFRELPVKSEVACLVGNLPRYHRDPFDRMLVAQAMTEPARLLTADAILTKYSDMVWLQGS